MLRVECLWSFQYLPVEMMIAVKIVNLLMMSGVLYKRLLLQFLIIPFNNCISLRLGFWGFGVSRKGEGVGFPAKGGRC